MPIRTLNALRSIFKDNLGIKNTERVLVFIDRQTKKESVTQEDATRRQRLRDIANIACDIGRGFAKELAFIEYPAGGAHGKEPPKKIWQAAFGHPAIQKLEDSNLLRPIIMKKASPEKIEAAAKIIHRHRKSAVDAIVALSNYSTSHTMFRHFLCTIAGTRYASMPLFDMQMLTGAMNLDWKALARRTRKLAKAINRSVSIRITTPDGTDLRMGTRGRRAVADTGILTRPGAFGNLPAGEAYLAPLEGTAQGTLVLNWAPTRRLASPITLDINEGRVVTVSGRDEYARILEAKLGERRDNANIAELGIGTNDQARRPDNILESEKILGTVHVALGDNSTFGGTVKTPFHQDFVFFSPSLIITDREGARHTLLKNGRLLIDE